ncbi:MAG: hypothetical protein PVI27_11295, partial [Desulfobacteraceae bacterium]
TRAAGFPRENGRQVVTAGGAGDEDLSPAPPMFDGSVERPIFALRCISKSLRRRIVRLTPLRFARRKLNFFRNRLVFDFLLLYRV